MAAQITNYQCPSCTGPLHFVGESGRLECDYCGGSFDVAEIEALYAEKDAKAEAAFTPAEDTAEGDAPGVLSGAEKDQRARSKWDESTISDDWGEDTDNMRAYNCPSCGAEVMCEATTAATHCPYCGNPTIIPGQFGGTLKPDYVIPFKLDKDAAIAALKKHYRKKPFLPKTFTDSNQIKKIQGIYVPFWFFDADAAAECWFDCSNSRTHREGDYLVTETQHFDVRRFGTVSFDRIPTDASDKMPDDLMDSIEPFDYSELKPFSSAYLPGYLADKYDVGIEQSKPRADRRCTASAEDVMRSDVRGYESVNMRRSNVYIDRGEVHYALLPVWILKTKWQDRSYVFAMNGQTGKLVGDLPVSKKRFWGTCFGLTAGLAVCFNLLVLLSQLLG